MTREGFPELDTVSLKTPKRMLVIAPHHDDECIGAGGLIADHNKNGGETFVITVLSGESGVSGKDIGSAQRIRNEELLQAARVLGVTQVYHLPFPDRHAIDATDVAVNLISTFRKVRPEIVIAPHLKERDPEHAIVARAAREAMWLSAADVFPNLGKASPPVKLLLGYEVWTPIENPQLYIDISHVIEVKLAAIKAHRSQVADSDWMEAAKGLARYRGVTSGCGKFIEAFEVYSIAANLLWPFKG